MRTVCKQLQIELLLLLPIRIKRVCVEGYIRFQKVNNTLISRVFDAILRKKQIVYVEGKKQYIFFISLSLHHSNMFFYLSDNSITSYTLYIFSLSVNWCKQCTQNMSSCKEIFLILKQSWLQKEWKHSCSLVFNVRESSYQWFTLLLHHLKLLPFPLSLCVYIKNFQHIIYLAAYTILFPSSNTTTTFS